MTDLAFKLVIGNLSFLSKDYIPSKYQVTISLPLHWLYPNPAAYLPVEPTFPLPPLLDAFPKPPVILAPAKLANSLVNLSNPQFTGMLSHKISL